VFTLDAEAGTLAFGDGLHGRRPPRGARIRAAYDYSAGAAGNVGKGAINAGTALPAGFTVANPVPTWGGTDAEDVAQGEKQVTRMLQHRDRLVTAADFEAITLRTPGVEVGRVDVLPAFHPDLSPNEPGDAPGVVTLMVLPRRDAAHPDAPEPDGAFLDAICRHLDPRRLVTTELVLRGPRYRDLVISVGVNVVAGFNAGEVVDAVRQRLRQWLAAVGDASLPEVVPIAGTAGNARRRGWPLRTAVTEKELLAEVARVAGVLSVNEVLLAEKGQGEQPQVPMSGLDLPRIVGLAVGVGDPLPLDAVTGVADTAIPAMTRRRIAVPVTPERC
jgi:predicted phage baseplate assembly protein